MKAVYFGAGCDFDYIKHMPNSITDFYLVDSQPFSEYGTLTSYRYNTSNLNCLLVFIIKLFPFLKKYLLKKENGFSRPNFINNLKRNAIKNNIQFQSHVGNKLIFKHKHQTITYFINTAMIEHIDLIGAEISGFKHIMIMGFHPDDIILKYTNVKPIIWTNLNTCICPDILYDKYAKENGEANNIPYLLNYKKDYCKNFESFNLIDTTGAKYSHYIWEDLIKQKEMIKFSM